MPQQQATWRNLKRNHSNALPRYVIAYDTETLPDNEEVNGRRRSHSFRLGHAMVTRIVGNKPCGTKHYDITEREQFWQLLERTSASNYTTWVVCHNALFDLVVSGLPEQFEQAKLVIEWPRTKRQKEDNQDDTQHAQSICIIDSPPTIIACRCVASGGRIVFVDTLNWFPCSLKELGNCMALPKLDFPRFTAPDATWLAYCKRDTEICFRAFVELIRWNADNDMGMFRYTAASKAMSAYRHRFMQHQICVHDNDAVKRLERTGYFGGRTEVFKQGQIRETVHQYDVNSLFPSVMQSGMFPCKLEQFELSEEWTSDLPQIDYRRCLAHVKLDTPVPLYPYRTKRHVIYPTGQFETVLCGEELYDAWITGRIKAIRQWSQYELQPIFRLWVDTLWQMRCDYRDTGQTVYAEFAKRLLNSLYGKFGQRSPSWVNVPTKIAALPWSNWVELDRVTGERRLYRSFGWQVQQWQDKQEIDGTFVAVAAFVTSAARCRMNHIRSLAGKVNIHYQGVDSLVVTNEGQRLLKSVKLLDDFSLGKLRHQLTTDTGEITGCSDYTLGDKRVMSGCTIDLNAAEAATMKQHSFAAAKYLFNGEAINTVSEEWLDYHRSPNYTKGSVGENGWIQPPVMTSPETGSIGGCK